MKNLIFLITINSGSLFFCINAILGKEYLGIGESSSYLYFSSIFILLSFLIILSRNAFGRSKKMRKVNIFFYSFPFLLVFIYLIEQPQNDLGFRYFSHLMFFSIPAIYIGTFVSRNNLFNAMNKWLDLIFIVMTLGLFSIFPQIISARLSQSTFTGYQSFSYISSYAYCIGLFLVMFGNGYCQRFTFFYNKIYLVFLLGSIFFQIICVFLFAGRGSFVVLIFATIIAFWIKFKNKVRLTRLAISIISVFIMAIIIYNFLPQEIKTVMKEGSDRIFSYISSTGVDMSQTSNRDIVYNEAWTLIKIKPLTGYGIFKYVDSLKIGYPHNIILEFLIQGGLIFLVICIVCLLYLIIKLKRIIKIDKTNLFILPIAVYPFIALLFSGSYLTSSLFWFVVSYVANYKTNIVSINKYKKNTLNY